MSTTDTTEQVTGFILDAIVDFGAEPDTVSPEARLDQLDIDSLDLVELRQMVAERYQVEVTREALAELQTLGDVIALISRLIA